MQLRRKFLETEVSAATNYLQVGHRRTAVEYGVAGMKKIHDLNLEMLGGDPFTVEMEGLMREWVTETLFQGAYTREYHLWKKDCKAYFPARVLRNGGALIMKTRGQSFTELVCEALGLFNVDMPSEILDTIERVRTRVNVMKHDAGLELEHFVTEADYVGALGALEGFWNVLAFAEVVGP
jgi:hypothetical protein